MKKVVVISILAFLVSIVSFAQKSKGTSTISYKTSAKCEMCKQRIERDLSLQKGITKAKLNLEDKVVTVSFNPKKTDAQKIKEAITLIGYDADDMMANQAAHDKLPDCCQKTASGH